MSTAVASQITELTTIAAELFNTDVTVEQVHDPEIAGRVQTVFHVTVSDNVQQAMRQRMEWYRRTMELLGDDYNQVALAMVMTEDDRT